MSLLVRFFALSVCVLSFSCGGSGEEPWQTEAKRQRDLAAKRITRDLNLELVGTGGGLMGAVHKLSLSFNSPERWSTAEAREKFLQAHAIFLEQVNGSALVRAHADSDPFGPEQIGLSISYLDEQGVVSIVSTYYSDKITYRRGSSNGPRLEDFLEESLPQN